ncbi:MAG: hypothetical protein LBD75_02815 [Candidatus Peribacteria bacterium]|nr:hypothetical protein [Candidatus Peribacteria bacterium]
MNRGRKIVLSMMCVFVIATIAFVACHNESDPTPADDGIEYLIPDDAKVIVDNAKFFKIPGQEEFLMRDGDLAVGIGVSAIRYYLPNDIKHYQEYYNLLNSDRDVNILKLTIGNKTEKGFPVIKVILPSEDEYLETKERWNYLLQSEVETRSTTSLVNVIPNTSTMNAVFNHIKNLNCPLAAPVASNYCIPFRYATDGCFARAHYMRKILSDYGYNCWKIFSFGDLQATSLATGCCAEWDWHVAVIVNVDTGVSTAQYVFDPSLFSQPISVSTWLNKQKGCGSSNSGSVDSYSIVSSENYAYNWSPGSYSTDNDYTSTLAFLNSYANASGCY